MRLVKAEHNEKGIWYFSTPRKCASYINGADPNVYNSLNSKHNKVKGWTLEWVDADDVLSKYIDPER